MSSSWINRMKDLEVPPPANGWETVAALLDESLNGAEFPARLHDTAIEPPVSTWNKIQTQLDGENTPLIPLQKRSIRSTVIRYAAAACIISLVAFAAIRLFAPGYKMNEATQTAVIPVPQKKENAAINPSANDTAEQENQATQKEGDPLEQSKRTYAKLDMREKFSYNGAKRKLYRSPAQLASSFTDDSEFSKNPELQYPHRAAVNDSPAEDADRYIMFKDSYGRFIRISKKLSTLFCCVSGEEQDEKCVDQLKQWREKIASSPFNPSPDNFMDILDLVNSLQDNRN